VSEHLNSYEIFALYAIVVMVFVFMVWMIGRWIGYMTGD
jgi:hypothetical protein